MLSKSAPLALAMVAMLLSPVAAASPAQDALTFVSEEQKLAQKTASDTALAGLRAWSNGSAAALRLATNLSLAGIKLWSDSSTLAINAAGAAARDGIRSYDQVARDSGNLTENAARSSLQTYDTSAGATLEATRVAAEGGSAILGGTGENAADLAASLSRETLETYDDAAEDLGDGLAGPARTVLESYDQTSDQVLRDLAQISLTLLGEYARAAENATATTRDASLNALRTYNATADAGVKALDAGSRNGIGAWDQLSRDSINVTANASLTALAAYDGATNATMDATSGAARAGIGLWATTSGAGIDLAAASARSAIGAWDSASGSAINSGADVARAGIGAWDSLTDAGISALEPGNALFRAIALGLLQPCPVSEGGGFRAGGQGDCIGRGVVGYDGPGGGSLLGPRTMSSHGPSSPSSQNAPGPNSPGDGDPWNCGAAQYGFIAESNAGANYGYYGCITLATTVSTGLGFEAIWRIGANGKDSVRLDYTKPTATLTVTNGFRDITYFAVIVQKTVFELDTPSRFGDTVTLKFSGVNVGLLGDTTLDSRLILDYTATQDTSKWIELYVTPDKAKFDEYYNVRLGEFDEGDGRKSLKLSPPSTFKVDLTVRKAVVDESKWKLVLTHGGAEVPAVVTIRSGSGDPLRFLIDGLPPSATIDAHTKAFRPNEYMSVDKFSVYANISIGQSRVRNLWIPLADLNANIKDVPSLRDLVYTQTIDRYPQHVEPCNKALWNLVEYDTYEQTQTCVSAVPQQSNARIVLNSGEIALNMLPAAKIDITFGPRGAVAYKETPVAGLANDRHAMLEVGDSPLFGDLKEVTLDNVLSIDFVPGATVGGQAGNGGTSKDCTPKTKGPSGKVDKNQKMIFRSTYDGFGKARVKMDANGEPAIDVWLTGLAALSTENDNKRFSMVFGPQGGNIERLDLNQPCQKFHVDRATGVQSVTLLVGDGESSGSPGLTIGDLKLLHGSRLSFWAEGPVTNWFCGDAIFRLDASAQREANGRYKVYVDVDLKESWQCGQTGKTEYIGPGTGRTAYEHKFVGKWVVTFRTAQNQ